MVRYVKANTVLSLFSKQSLELKKGLPIRPSEMGAQQSLPPTPPGDAG